VHDVYTRIHIHREIEKSIILREGYAAFYVNQGAKRRIISLRALKSEAPSCRNDRQVRVRGGLEAGFGRMTEIGGPDLQEWRALSGRGARRGAAKSRIQSAARSAVSPAESAETGRGQ